MKFILTLFLLSLFTNLFAQFNLSGTVSDSSKNPISFAGISLKDAVGNLMNSYSDINGNFSFKNLNPGQYLLMATHVGYRISELSFRLQKDTSLKIGMQQTNKDLGEVIVVGNKQIIERTIDKIVYSISNSITATGTDALQAISQIPGVRVQGNEISVVGKGLTKVMINNRLVQLAGEDLSRYLKSISANEISSIELITNPSAKYEAEGNAGLINIITKQNKKQGYSGNLQLASKLYAPGESSVYGIHTFGEISESGNISYNWGRWSAYGSFNHVQDRHLEGFETDVFYPKQSWLQTDTGLYTYNNVNVIGGVDYKISPKATVGLSFLRGRSVYKGSDNVNNPIYNSLGKLDSTLKTFAIYYPVALSNAFNMHSAISLDTSGKNLSFNADYFSYFRTDRSHFESNSYNANGQYKPEGNTKYYDTNKQVINVFTLKADAELPTHFAKFTFGGKVTFINNYSNAFYFNKLNGGLVYNNHLSNEFDYTENTQALYAVVDKDVNKWKLQAGLRGELTQTKGYSYTLKQTTSNNYFRLFPSLLISYQPDPNNTYSLSVGRRINRPSFWNLNPFKSLYTAYSYGQGNPYLQPEYNSNSELSYSFKSIIKSSLFVNITNNGFYNVVMANRDTNLVYTIPLNFIQTNRIGILENVSLKLTSWWESDQQVSFYHTNSYSKIPNINNIHGFGSYISSNNSLFFNKRKTLAGAVNFWCQFPEVDHIGRSNTYYKLDIGIKATTLNRKLDLVFNLNDAFRSSASAISTTVNGIPQTFTNFQINRFYQLSLSYRFGNSSNNSNNRSTGNEDERGRIH